jgi:hypothetical protein
MPLARNSTNQPLAKPARPEKRTRTSSEGGRRLKRWEATVTWASKLHDGLTRREAREWLNNVLVEAGYCVGPFLAQQAQIYLKALAESFQVAIQEACENYESTGVCSECRPAFSDAFDENWGLGESTLWALADELEHPYLGVEIDDDNGSDTGEEGDLGFNPNIDVEIVDEEDE